MSFDRLKTSITQMGVKEGLDLIMHIRTLRSAPPVQRKKKAGPKKPAKKLSGKPIPIGDLFSDDKLSSLSEDKLDKLLELFGDGK
jgi:hypothetical protein